LPATPPDAAAAPPARGAARRAFHRAALLWRRRRGRLRRLGGVEAGLLLAPVVAVELVLLEGLLTLPRLRIHEHFGLNRAREHPRGKSGDDRDRPTILHGCPLRRRRGITSRAERRKRAPRCSRRRACCRSGRSAALS